MEIVETKTKHWKPVNHSYQTSEGLILTEENKKQFCKYYSIPASLISVDNKFGTDTLKQVIDSNPSYETAKLLVDDGRVVTVLDPKSKFISDDEFQSKIIKIDGVEPIETRIGNELTYKYEFPISDKDQYMSDIFSKSLDITRLPQGGIFISAGLLRLVCTNGAKLQEKGFTTHLRNGNVTDDLIKTRAADIMSFDLQSYFEHLWTSNGKPIPASVAHFHSMKTTISHMTDDDTSDIYFPYDVIRDCYMDQGIDIDKLSMGSKERLPAGISYYDCYQMLTNAAKTIENPTTFDMIEISKYSTPSRVEAIKNSTFSYTKVPMFDSNIIKKLKGDI